MVINWALTLVTNSFNKINNSLSLYLSLFISILLNFVNWIREVHLAILGLNIHTVLAPRITRKTDVMEQQIKNLEKKIEDQNKRFEDQNKKFKEMIQLMRETRSLPSTESTRSNNSGKRNAVWSLGYVLKLEFPKFDESNPRIWIKKCCKYFSLCKIPKDQRVDLASLHVRWTKLKAQLFVSERLWTRMILLLTLQLDLKMKQGSIWWNNSRTCNNMIHLKPT